MKHEKTYVNILSSSKNSIYCFYNYSEVCKREYDSSFGEGYWSRSLPVLKLYYIENGIQVEKKSVLPDAIADNWYITFEDHDIDLFVELGRISDIGAYTAIATSNILTIPRAFHSIPVESYYVNTDTPWNSVASQTYLVDKACCKTKIESHNPMEIKTVKNDIESENQRLVRLYVKSQQPESGSSW